MMETFKPRGPGIWCLFTGLLWMACQSRGHDPRGVRAAMEEYDRLILHMNVDSIAMLYAPEGELGDIARGRDSIRHFLARFRNIRVLSQASGSDTVLIGGDTAWQLGTYHQRDILPSGDSVSVHGTFKARWVWIYPGGWHIRRMDTKPIP